MNIVEKIETSLQNYLLRDVIFFIDGGKTLKKGKLILFKFKEFHYVFTLKNEKEELKVYEIPYPYNTEFKDDHTRFSYSLEHFTLPESELYYRTKLLDKSNCDKLFDQTLVLSAI
tara:strand:+ start:16024 stop:16368 length:345 start_codon:yes stop_codon:yes gene_type:complete